MELEHEIAQLDVIPGPNGKGRLEVVLLPGGIEPCASDREALVMMIANTPPEVCIPPAVAAWCSNSGIEIPKVNPVAAITNAGILDAMQNLERRGQEARRLLVDAQSYVSSASRFHSRMAEAGNKMYFGSQNKAASLLKQINQFLQEG